MVPDEADGWVALYGNVLRTGEPIRFERELVATGRHLELSAFRVEPASRKQVAVLFKDVTARKRAELELRRLNETLEARVAEAIAERLQEQERLREAEEALRQAQKMEAVGQLTGGLAHDFNNLLAGISGAFEMIGVRLAQGRSADVENYLSAGQGATRRAAALTHRLLAFSRRQTLQPKPVDINRLMTEFVDLVRRTVGPAIEVETVAAAGCGSTMVDPTSSRTRCSTCASTRATRCRDGGKITIETGNKWLDERTAIARSARSRPVRHGLRQRHRHRHRQGDPRARVRSVLHHQAARRRHRARPVDGLRLRAAEPRPCADLFGGRAGHDGVHLPAAARRRRGARMMRRAPRRASRTEAGETVLVVDDEPTIRMLVADALGDLGYACRRSRATAPSGLKILQSAERIDLLITDVGLPGGLNGRQVADAARATRPDLQGPVHHRLCRERRVQPRPCRTRHGGADQAVRRRPACVAGRAHAEGSVTPRMPCARRAWRVAYCSAWKPDALTMSR